MFISNMNNSILIVRYRNKSFRNCSYQISLFKFISRFVFKPHNIQSLMPIQLSLQRQPLILGFVSLHQSDINTL